MSKTTNPSKERKNKAEAPMHERQNMVAAPLEKDLRKDFDRRSLPVKSGDEVEVTRGDHRGKTSEVRDVDLDGLKVVLEDVSKEKVDGTEVHPKIDPSNIMIIEPDLSDPEREEIVERSGGEVAEELKAKEEEKEGEGKAEEEEAEEGEEEGFKCEICGNVYDSKQGLNIHKGKSHPDHVK